MKKNLVTLYSVSFLTSDGAPFSWSRQRSFFKHFEDAVYCADLVFDELVNGIDSGDKLIYEKVDDLKHSHVRQSCLLVDGLLVILKVIVSPYLMVLNGCYKPEHTLSDSL